MKRRSVLLLTLLCAALGLAAPPALAAAAKAKPRKQTATPAPTSPASHVEIKVNDLSERFIGFYNEASKPGLDADQRWKLWQTQYGFSAMPNDPAGMAMARALLDAAWPRYPEVMDRIVTGYAGMRPSPERQARAAAELLKLDQPMRLRLVAYVGFLEGNGFTLGNRGEVRVAIPIEDAPEHRAITAAHELTHAVHISLGALEGEGAQTVAAVALSEGLAMHASRALVPGGRIERYVEYLPGWFRDAESMQRQIYEAIRPQLIREDPDTLMRVTHGHGNTGLEREAYYLGWKVVELWLSEGRSLAQIARIPAARMVEEVDAAVGRLIARLPARNTAELD
ncbi:DUF2268 domain-containing putative Zn-dependent protease [Niveibacterium sp. 24ML]|uniref:DUF2268 domain-containing putative Zn-dependent protease n=1 Tax=Niveibacterium sp. 24ML TaxID=2985512 RepID=UPI00226F62A9|nr:DUF2268 domain-containing putative Zn-dependent protease [Niveibacterium sp. 24ML]MCX9157997.1 DUF2268 domain-containing putative Zn-dependent protease [Niveibacterium sp. 24ML]